MNEVLLWILVTFCTTACIIGIAGNCLVFYFAYKDRKRRAFRHVNTVVRKLAIADFLYSTCAAPLEMRFFIWRKIFLLLRRPSVILKHFSFKIYSKSELL